MSEEKKLTVVTYLQTCFACPSQWEATLDDGRMIYVRYRYGCLSVTVSREPTNDIMDAVGALPVFEEEIGDVMGGVLSYEDMKEVTKDKVIWP